MPYRPRCCEVCTRPFTPPHRATFLSTGDNHLRLCTSCRRATKDADAGTPAPLDTPTPHSAAPMRQLVFDLETWGLDRGWGTTLVAAWILHGGSEGPQEGHLTARDFEPWRQGKRSNDGPLVAAFFEVFKQAHIAYAHNGEFFDVRWLRTVALKYGLDMPRIKLVDPAEIGRKNYLLGRNSLESMTDFLHIKEQYGEEKMHISPDVWRGALMDDDDECWLKLVARCKSDVRLLNVLAGAVTRDVGMIDYAGSGRR